MVGKSKWEFLRDFYKECKKLNKDITTAKIAKLAKLKFSLSESEETIRKGLSNLLKAREYTSEIIKSVIDDSNKPKSKRNLVIFEEVGNYKPKPTKFTDPGTYLVLGCVHVPGHNVAMINGVTNLLGDLKDLKGLMLLGDFLDLNTLSSHDKGKFTSIKGLTLDQEYEAGNKVLGQLTAELPNQAHKVYLYGNHEDRWNRYMSDMEDAKRPLLSPRQALNLDKRHFHTYENWKSDYITLGNHLDLMHGQYYSTHSAKKHIDVYRGSVMYVHTHRVQTYIEGKTGGWNIGWGGDINSPFFNYMERGTKSQWLNGFSLVTIDEHGDHFVEQVICYNNKFYVGGKKYN